ncbi:S41 family peptidase [Miniphocaeibacter halophilus]|uniref:Uncharacterized protein n=1 Tax=Miniphocaeibacter halophilus TaxID=2931922 RepID=A0AC61MSH9_9FIRM|nr:S41 family peptidase [Miniphocaeibacter halophilus]QQK07166.1 hypothetical protein JFY71_07490 [Miniphocaeibacter halophilus]
MKKKRRRKNKKNNLFLIFFYIAIFVIAFLLFDPSKFLKGKKSVENKATLTHLTEKDKLEEFNFIMKLLEEDYPYLAINEKYSEVNLSQIKEKYEKLIIETKDDINYEKILSDFFKEFNQPNLFLLNSDDYYLYKEYEEINGNSPWYDVLNSEMPTLRYGEYKNNFKNSNYFSGLSMTILLENKIAYIKITDFSPLFVETDKPLIENFINSIMDYPYLIIDIRDNQGQSIEYVLNNIVEPLAHDTLVMNSLILERNENHQEFLNYYNYLPYITIKTDFEKSSQLKDTPISNDNLENFPLYREYNIRIEKKTNFKGEIFLLQNRNTRNAADFFSQFSNITDFASTVGQFTGGNGVNLNTAFIELPKSGFVLSMPVGMGINEEGSPNTEFGTYPEIRVDEESDALNILLEMLN